MTNSGRRWSARRLARGRSAALLLLLAVAVGVGARLVAMSASPVFASDTFQNLLIAQSLAQGRGFESGGSEHPDASRSVLFPATIAAVDAIVGDVERSARGVVVLAGALLVVPMFFLARSMFGPSAALAALPLGAVSCSVAASSRLLSTPLFVLLEVTTLALAWSAGRGRSRTAWLATGGAAGLAALTRPEGIAFLLVPVAWALAVEGRRASGRRPRRWRGVACAGYALAAFAAIYAPYVAWASSKLGRLAPAPGIEYVQAQRDVSDHLGLRDVESPVRWTLRAQFMLTDDHRSLFLATYFLTGAFPQPDPELTVEAPEPADQTAHAQRWARWRYVSLRRWEIVRENLTRAPRYAVWEHFLPPAIVGLALIGLVTTLGSPRRRSAMALLVLSGVASLAPLVSHIEERFFYLPFAIGTILAAGGWGALAWWLGRFRGSSPYRRTAEFLIHVPIVLAIAATGARHEASRAEAIDRERFLQETANALRDRLPAGAILANAQHVPYWSGHPYRPIPFASPDAILAYAQAQGARALVLEGARDLGERPDLAWLTSGKVPTPYRLVWEAPHPSGGSLVVCEIDLPGSSRP